MRLLLPASLALCFCIAILISIKAHCEPVLTGIDVLQAENFLSLQGRKVGIVANPASVNSKLETSIEILRRTSGCQLTAIFGPEHGVFGDEYAGIKIPDQAIVAGALPVYSLYGKTRRPTADMLRGLDALLFDLQDIGSRSYTYISTMRHCLEACAELNIEFIVLDRPNPLGGERIEGPTVEKGFESFLGFIPVPYLHGMTMGELARFTQATFVPKYTKLKVIPMKNWKRSMAWNETGLSWVPTSPHIPFASSCVAYAMTGIIGELGQISNGVGYTLPFEIVGTPWVNGIALSEALNQYWKSARQYYLSRLEEPVNISLNLKSCPPLKGVYFRPIRYKPFYSLFKEKPCQGIQIFADPKTAETLVEINFRVLHALNAPELFKQASSSQIATFNKVCGTDQARTYLTDDRNLDELFARWRIECQEFREIRKKHLIYE